MKKQIFSLMLSAAILTTNPLFAMEDQPEEKTNCIVSHQYVYVPSLDSDFRFENADEMEGRGLFHILPNDVIINIQKDCPIEHILLLSRTSKGMYNWCQNPIFWGGIANKVKLTLTPLLCIKDQVLTDHAYYLNLFSKWGDVDNSSDEAITYVVRASQFENFVKKPCIATWWPFSFPLVEPAAQSYRFSIRKKPFELYAKNESLTVEEARKMNKDWTFSACYAGSPPNGNCFWSGRGAFYIKEITPAMIEDEEVNVRISLSFREEPL